MLSHRRRRWFGIEPALGWRFCLVAAEEGHCATITPSSEPPERYLTQAQQTQTVRYSCNSCLWPDDPLTALAREYQNIVFENID